jgi:intracellular proteinase inhibitor BsuPI
MRHCTPFLAFLLATACLQDPAVPRQRDEIILRLTVRKPTIRIGEADTITVTATNNFGDNVSIRFPNSCQVFAYIRDLRGRIVTPGRGWSCLPVVSTLNLARDEAKTFQFVWTGLSEFAGGVQPETLAPGEYFATATLQAGDFAVHSPPVRVILQQ